MSVFLSETCIGSQKQERRPIHQAAKIAGDFLRNFTVPHIKRPSAYGTVASLSPVAGSDVAIGPLLMLTLGYHTLLASVTNLSAFRRLSDKDYNRR